MVDAASTPSPIDLLAGLEQANLGNQLDDPDKQVGDFWRGFVFQVEELNIAVPFAGEFEIVPAQEVARLPLTQPWVIGMTNIRGEIYTLVDFSAFIGRKPIRVNPKCHFLLLPDPVLKSALVLDSRIRLRTFSVDLQNETRAWPDSGLDPYLERVIIDDDEKWGVLDIMALCDAPEFQRIGV